MFLIVFSIYNAYDYNHCENFYSAVPIYKYHKQILYPYFNANSKELFDTELSVFHNVYGVNWGIYEEEPAIS